MGVDFDAGSGFGHGKGTTRHARWAATWARGKRPKRLAGKAKGKAQGQGNGQEEPGAGNPPMATMAHA